jgi:hypothetical protein
MHASVGTSTTFHSVSCTFLSFINGSEESIINHCIPAPKHWWQLGLVVGIMIGAFLSARLSHSLRRGLSPKWTVWTSITSFKMRAIMAFLGGFIMLLGARIADGCTSGNGLSGIALLSIGSMTVIASMFVGGILVALFYKRK